MSLMGLVVEHRLSLLEESELDSPYQTLTDARARPTG